MKLIRLKIGNRFRSLPKDFEIEFSKTEPQSISNDPICFVGTNGSGKSNVLEALAEIFEYLDLYFLKYTSQTSEVATIDQFIVEYLLPAVSSSPPLFSNLIRIGNTEFAHIKIRKLSGRAPIFSEMVNGQPLPLVASSEFLPTRIIGYSSGQNELLSIPFKKLNFKYYHYVREEQKISAYRSYTSPPRLAYMSYEESPLIILCNYIMQSDAEIDDIKSKIGIDGIDSFEMYISTSFRRLNSIKVTSDLERLIAFFKSSATQIIFSHGENVRLKFIVNSDFQAKFKEQFPDASSLFNALSWLSLLNLNGIPMRRMSILLSATDNTYLGYRPYDYEPDYKLFTIDNIYIRKIGVEQSISYRTLSDGEHQFGFIVGMLSIFRQESTLFLLDEPETHFNPKWKYTYLETFKKVMVDFKNQILLTTHDPVLISGLTKENVIVFRKPDANLPRIFRPQKDLRGMGVDAILMSEIFQFDTAVDFNTKQELIEFRELSIKRSSEELSLEEDDRFKKLYEKLRSIEFAEPLNDPIYREYLSSFDDLDLYKKQFLSEDELRERKRISEEIVARMRTKLQS
jgi:restriction system-associated AAA family ATPase